MLDKSKICVVIPCYNNEKTVAEVALSVVPFVENKPIVVLDGCTDNSAVSLQKVSDHITTLSYSPNKGKGAALDYAFEYARSMNYDYAITMDADGQHLASDLPFFFKQIEDNYGALILGSRLLKQDNMPAGNTFANKFSNFWFTVHTAKHLDDTQTGFRAYPLFKMGDIHPISKRYEAELELLLRCAWRNIKLVSQPIQVYYPPIDERVSHFRKGPDFMRIFLLNTIMCFVAILYGYPSMLLRKIFNRINFKKI